MEWINTLASLVGSLGVPVVLSGILVWLNYKQQEAHKLEMEKITEALNNNTQALVEMKAVLRRD